MPAESPTQLSDVKWIHGAPNCALSEDPPIQVVAHDDDTYVFRQSKCVNFEAPFLYLLFGRETVLLHDSGATASPSAFPLRQTVENLIHSWMTTRGITKIEPRITHSHGHGDHILGDGQFSDLPAGSVAPVGVAGVSTFFGIEDWPSQRARFDLGGRWIDVLPTPGHAEDHIVLFDGTRGLLLTGDMLYPGMLFVSNWNAYRLSVQRLAGFCRERRDGCRPVTSVLGAHIEMSATPGVAYPYGSTFQPDEHALPLSVEHVFALEEAMATAGAVPQRIVRPSFIVEPAT
jgi:hydroxyacylglutathione hydrolase